VTWSIVALDADTGAFAVAVATRNFPVGATVPHLRAGFGAVATQSISNRYLGPRVLDAMAAGLSPDLAVAAAVASDEGRGPRQLHAVDRHGRTAAYTGGNCVTWRGSVADHAVSVAGNMLANASVVPATLAAPARWNFERGSDPETAVHPARANSTGRPAPPRSPARQRNDAVGTVHWIGGFGSSSRSARRRHRGI
jgi:uncharacterized Ntn-hydrolase superfamily protein